MKHYSSLTDKIINFIKLTIPVILTQFAITGGSFMSIVLTGQYSTIDLAGISVGYNIWVACFYGISGILLGLLPILAQLRGAHKVERIPVTIMHGFYVATILAALLIISGIVGLKPLLNYLNLAPDAYEICINYMMAIGVGILPLIWTCTLRNTVDSHGYTRYSMYIMLAGISLHIFLDFALILGYFGFPALGGLGAGIATAIAYWFNCLAFLGLLIWGKPFRKYNLFRQWITPDFVYIKEQFSIGIPIGLAIFCESSIFSIAGLVITQYGTEIIAAHQAANSFASLFYGFPLSISTAATIAVGYEVGAKEFKEAKTYSYIARGSAIIIAICVSAYTFTHLDQIATLYTNDYSMVDLIGTFLAYAVFFTVIDAFGTPLQGILRGYKDVKIISTIAITCYWGASIPIAAFFMYALNWGPYGVWMGLLGGVLIAALGYLWRTWYIQNKKFAY
ncbi:MATE family efflux transporter [uncultured Veillonella sp.]|uniref:MATE family efflux transporter n=1 Tax=uncultured Veillonella sp. TaxID=159268 RepID=UPI002604C346|nr:MATE family efflux transporter [uncultured Veillonella sp.]